MSERLFDEATQHQLAVEWYRDGVFGIAKKRADFHIQKSGRRSPHYFDVRPALSNVPVRSRLVSTMLDLTTRKAQDYHPDATIASEYDHIVGDPEAMTSYAAMAAHEADLPLLQPRVKTNKITGNTAPISGGYEPGAQVALWDNALSSGESLIDRTRSLAEEGIVVKDLFVLLDREEGGHQDVAQVTRLSVVSAMGVHALVDSLEVEGLLTPTQLRNFNNYFEEYEIPVA